MRFQFAALFLLFSLSPIGIGKSQVITESSESSNYLANQISVSSGMPAENYHNYAMSLARTLARLSPAQQAAVFGVGGAASASSASEPDDSGSGSSESESTGDVLADLLAGDDDDDDDDIEDDDDSGSVGSSSGSSGPSGSSGSSGSTTVGSSSGSSSSSSGSSSGESSGESSEDESDGNWWDSLANFFEALLNAANEFFGALSGN